MSDQTASRFAPQNKTTNERLSTTTVGLVALSDFRKRRAEVLEQQEREARNVAISGTSTPDRSLTGTPDNAGSDSAANGPGAGPVKKKNKKKVGQGKKLLSFGDDEGDDEDGGASGDSTAIPGSDAKKSSKFKANTALGVVPKAMTKSALRKEATERETLRREFVCVQEAVKATEIAIPFVFYDGSNIPGGTVRMKKGDFVWVFLDKSRKVGAERNVGEQANSKRGWARVGVDDLMLVRGTVIIPHVRFVSHSCCYYHYYISSILSTQVLTPLPPQHYDFYYFVINRSMGAGGKRLFEYSDLAPTRSSQPPSIPVSSDPLVTAESKAAAAKYLPDINTLEGAMDEPTLTKVVDRRWYERHKHIYPASTWQEFDPEKDYSNEVRKDTGGNTFFYSK